MKKSEYELLRYIGIPNRVRTFLRTSKISNDAVDDSWFFYGPPGTGKTIKAASILAATFFNKIHTPTALEMVNPTSLLYMGESSPKFTKHFVFARVPDMLARFKKTFKQDSEEDEGELIDLYSKAKLLVLDDIGVELATNWAYLMLYLIVDNRYNDMLPTIFTSNLDLKELGRHFVDERLISRIMEMCTKDRIQKMNGCDYRMEGF